MVQTSKVIQQIIQMIFGLTLGRLNSILSVRKFSSNVQILSLTIMLMYLLSIVQPKTTQMIVKKLKEHLTSVIGLKRGLLILELITLQSTQHSKLRLGSQPLITQVIPKERGRSFLLSQLELRNFFTLTLMLRVQVVSQVTKVTLEWASVLFLL